MEGIRHRIARKGVETSQRLGRHRRTIERTTAWLAGCRRRHRRYERKAEHFLAFTRVACTLIRYPDCWYAQLSLLQALCLWGLPDGAGGGPDGHQPFQPLGGATAVRTVKRWLAMAGTGNRAPGQPDQPGDSARRCLHPFVAEAGDPVALALETGQPERFLWVDEKGVADNIGGRAGHIGSYRRQSLWIPPSVGWSTLDPRAQRLVADVLVMLNLLERDGHPDEVEERLARMEQPGMSLPPCIRTDRQPLQPGLLPWALRIPRCGTGTL